MVCTARSRAEDILHLIPRLHKLAQGRMPWPPHPLMRSLSVGQMLAMQHLIDAGPLTMRDLSERCRVATSTMTDLTDRLVRLGMAARRADPRDRRIVRVQATTQGRRAFAARRRHALRHMQRLLDTLSETDQRRLLKALGIIERIFAA